MEERARAYVDAELITEDVAKRIMAVIRSERNHEEYLNEAGEGPPEENNNLSTKLSHEQLQRLLEEREEMMKASPDGSVTDQWRVYEHVVNCIQNGQYLRLLVQASAGTGKPAPQHAKETLFPRWFASSGGGLLFPVCYLRSFLLTTIFLWALVHNYKTKAAAPTGSKIKSGSQHILSSMCIFKPLVFEGIAAANVEIPKTDVAAVTLHKLFEFDGEYASRMDFSKLTHSGVRDLLLLQILLLDEISMIDTDCFNGTVD